jgi:hypothetical protein
MNRLESLKQLQDTNDPTFEIKAPPPKIDEWPSLEKKILKPAPVSVHLESLQEFPSLNSASGTKKAKGPNPPKSSKKMEKVGSPQQSNWKSSPLENANQNTWGKPSQNLSLANKLKLQKLCAKFPNIQKELVEEIFLHEGCNETVAARVITEQLDSRKRSNSLQNSKPRFDSPSMEQYQHLPMYNVDPYHMAGASHFIDTSFSLWENMNPVYHTSQPMPPLFLNFYEFSEDQLLDCLPKSLLEVRSSGCHSDVNICLKQGNLNDIFCA